MSREQDIWFSGAALFDWSRKRSNDRQQTKATVSLHRCNKNHSKKKISRTKKQCKNKQSTVWQQDRSTTCRRGLEDPHIHWGILNNRNTTAVSLSLRCLVHFPPDPKWHGHTQDHSNRQNQNCRRGAVFSQAPVSKDYYANVIYYGSLN